MYGRNVPNCPRKYLKKLKWNLNATSYWTLHFCYWLGATFSDVPVLLSLQKDVTLSVKSVITLFQHRVISSGCSVLKNSGNHKTWLCWPIQPENWNCSCPLPGLEVVCAWVSCWPGGIDGLVFEGSSLRMLCVVHSRFDVSAEQFCVRLWPVGAQSGSLNPLLLCLLSWAGWIFLGLQTGAWGRTSGLLFL